VIASQQPAVLAQLGNPDRTEILLEEGARLVSLERDGAGHAPANVLERARDWPRVPQLALPVEHLAARLECRIGGTMVVARPAVELGPFHWLKLGIWNVQGVDGLPGCGHNRGREPHCACHKP